MSWEYRKPDTVDMVWEWKPGGDPFPTPADLLDGIHAYKEAFNRDPDRIVIKVPEFAFGIEVVSG